MGVIDRLKAEARAQATLKDRAAAGAKALVDLYCARLASAIGCAAAFQGRVAIAHQLRFRVLRTQQEIVQDWYERHELEQVTGPQVMGASRGGWWGGDKWLFAYELADMRNRSFPVWRFDETGRSPKAQIVVRVAYSEQLGRWRLVRLPPAKKQEASS